MMSKEPSFLECVEILKGLNNPEGKQTTDYSNLSFDQFNELIGLPLHPQTLQPRPLTNIQKTFFTSYCTDKQNLIHLNKARQCGWTELILRLFAYHAFHKYKGKKIIIIPGTSEKTTKQIFNRIKDMFTDSPLRGLIIDSNSLYFKLSNGTEFYGLPASVEAVTGWTKIGAFLLDEAAKWKLVDDSPVINSILPIVKSNKADCYMISTPKGPQGFFYHIEMNPETVFTLVKYDLHAGGQELYTNEERMDMIRSSEEDPNQEYLNQYVSGRDSIFGAITEEDREEGEIWE